MQFTSPQLDDIQAYLDQYEPHDCPICSNKEWTTIPYPGAIVAQQEATVNIFKTLQVVQQVCNNCGYIVQFSASKIGVDQNGTPAKKKKKKK